MRILHVTNHFHPCVGGIERHVLDLCRHLSARGHVSDVLCLDKCSDGSRLPPEGTHHGIKIHRVPFLDLKYYKPGRGVLKHAKHYDTIHIHGLGYFLDLFAATKGLHKKRLILSTHGGFFHTGTLRLAKGLHFRTLARASLKRMDAIVAVSGQDLETFSHISPRVRHIPNGIDFSLFRAGPKEPKSFLYLGRISRNKRVPLLLEAFRLAARKDGELKLRLLCSGPAPELSRIKSMVASPGLEQSEVVESPSEIEKLRFLASSQFFVSASGYEGFGISLLEGMASGCVPLVNNIRAFRDILEGRGFLIDYSNKEEAALKMLEAAASDHKALRKAVRERAMQYDWGPIMREWEEVYVWDQQSS